MKQLAGVLLIIVGLLVFTLTAGDDVLGGGIGGGLIGVGLVQFF